MRLGGSASNDSYGSGYGSGSGSAVLADPSVGFAAMGYSRGMDGPPEYAGFWIRFAAFVLDLIFAIPLAVVVWGVGLGVMAVADIVGNPAAAMDTWWFTQNAFWYLLTAWLISSSWQGTPGKRVCRLYVARSSGQAVGFWRALVRTVIQLVSILPVFIGYFMIGWTREKTGLHDLICDTRVMHGRP